MSGPWQVDTARDPGTAVLVLTGDNFAAHLAPDCRGSSSTVTRVEITANFHGQDLVGRGWDRS